MPSCDADAFVPLGGANDHEPFRAFGATDPAPDAPPAPEPDPCDAAFAAGRARGRAEAEDAEAALARDVAAALASIGAWRDELRTRYTQTLVTLAIETARKIVGEELEARPERWVAIVAAAIGRLVDREHVTVRVAPRLAAVLRAHGALALGDAGQVRVLDDPALEADACRVESRTGDVECGIAAQLAAVVEALAAAER
jgi:flagellar biosynthesis/type III secretory pathway protein FliH